MVQQVRARVAAAGAPAMATQKLFSFSSFSSSSPTSASCESSLDEVDQARTPLAAVAEAFEELARTLEKGADSDATSQGSELRLRSFSDACSLVSVLFSCLGFAFKFAEMEYVAKVHDLAEASNSYETLASMLDGDVECGTVRKPGSHSRNLRRVRQGLDLMRALFEQFLSSNDYSLREAASTAYEKVCAPYHTWAVRTAVGAGMYALPTRDQLVCKLNESHHSVRTGMQRFIDACSPIIQYIDTLYLTRNITLDCTLSFPSSCRPLRRASRPWCALCNRASPLPPPPFNLGRLASFLSQMGRGRSAGEIVYDTSDSYIRNRSRSRPSSGEWRNFMSPNLATMYSKPSSSGSGNKSDSEDEDMDMTKMLKDIEYLGASNMNWKERKDLENRKVVAMGGKPPKRQRLPLSVAKVPMKRQKLREQKKLQEDLYLGRFQKKRTNERSERRKRPEDGALMASEGYFKRGVLDVKHLLKPSRPKSDDSISVAKRKKKGKGKGKKKGGKKKRKH